MNPEFDFIMYYILTVIFGIFIASDIKHNKDTPFFLIIIHILLFISDFYWAIYYGSKLWTK